ncbi:helix-turn-helix domain-containing protein [Paenibacillus sp. NPDC058177]|uniref:helix-turn-helix domain-containing protein n=1 Tax=Paenibacillus sp. NPDC058177 TaxID=3346369 RepID=UPI0036D76534
MEAAATILTELEHYLRREALTLAQFAERTGLHSGTLSNIIHARRPIAMQQLDRITSAMGKPDGYFYEMYIHDYIIEGSADWRRIGPLLQRCAELDKLGAIKNIVQHIMDNLMYSPLLFEAAEALFAQGYLVAAALLYENVAAGEKLQHSERLALCQYRLFAIRLGDNQDENLRAANQFEPYIERLEEADQLDALKHLADIYASLHRWDKVMELAELMGHKADILYHHFRKDSVTKTPTRPIIYYILYANLLGSLVCDERGDYEQALQYASLYSDVSWAKSPVNEEESRVIEQFKEWATANSYLYRLMAGQVDVLPDYIKYVEVRENEIFQALFKIMQAANRFLFDVDAILLQFTDNLSYKEQHSRLGKYTQQLTGDKYTRFLTELAIYYLRKNNLEAGFEYLMGSLESSVRTRSNDSIVRCVGLFEKYRAAASVEQQEAYAGLIGEMHRINEERASYIINYRH